METCKCINLILVEIYLPSVWTPCMITLSPAAHAPKGCVHVHAGERETCAREIYTEYEQIATKDQVTSGNMLNNLEPPNKWVWWL